MMHDLVVLCILNVVYRSWIFPVSQFIHADNKTAFCYCGVLLTVDTTVVSYHMLYLSFQLSPKLQDKIAGSLGLPKSKESFRFSYRI